MDIPKPWTRVESRRRPGTFYYFNTDTGESSWEKPEVKETKETKEEAAPSVSRGLRKRPLDSNGHAQVLERKSENLSVCFSGNGSKRIVKPVRREEKTVCVVPPLPKSKQEPPKRIGSASRISLRNDCAPSMGPPSKLKRASTQGPSDMKPQLSAKSRSSRYDGERRTEAKNLRLKQSIKREFVATTAKPEFPKNDESAPSQTQQTAILVKAEPGAEKNISKLNRRISQSETNLRRTSLCSENNLFAAYSRQVSNEEDEAMDWEPVPEEKVTKSIQNIRQSFKYEDMQVDIQVEPSVFSDNHLVIVVDTNIFLSHLAILCRLREMAERGVVQLVLLVPWIVISELDYLKNNVELQHMARKAGKFIQSVLEKKQVGVAIQTGAEARDAEKMFNTDVNDDKILQACLQQKQMGRDVVLLSNDNMLLTKALGHGLKALSKEDIARQIADFANPRPEGIVFAVTPRRIASMIEELLLPVCTDMVESRFRSVFDDLWPRIISVKPPYTELKQIFQIYTKHWMAVFGEIYPKSVEAELKRCRELFLKAKNDTLADGEVETMVKFFVNFLEASKSKFSIRETLDDCISLIQEHLKEYQRGKNPHNSEPACDGKTMILELFQAVWGTIYQICGAISELLGIEYPEYVRFPNSVSLAEAKEIMPYVKQMVNKMLWQVTSYLANPRDELASVEFFTFLMNFLPKLCIGSNPPGTEKLALEHLHCFVSEEENLQMLKNGQEQMRAFSEKVEFLLQRLNQAG